VRCSRGSRRRRGQALVEFALISLALYILLATTIEMGRALHGAQALQQAADAGARELAKLRLPYNATLTDALYSTDPSYQVVRTSVFSEDYLVIDITNMSDADYTSLFDNAPILNQQLRPLMIVELAGATTYLRYPGALLTKSGTKSGLTVGIPLISSRASDGTETINIVPVVEEITQTGSDGTQQSSFSFVSTAPQRGLVALRINYPFQAATLSAYEPQPLGGPTNVVPISANDGGVSVGTNTTGGSVGAGGTSIGTFAGPYGLGVQLAFGKNVRPFRQVLTARSVGYRRELSF
jgi:Flp pilus assembly protein TadG